MARFALILVAAVLAGGPACAADPCAESDRLAALGSPQAADFERICALTGAADLTPECVAYLRALTEPDPAIAPARAVLDSLAGVCRHSMPGVSVPSVAPRAAPPLTCGDDGVECRPPDPAVEVE